MLNRRTTGERIFAVFNTVILSFLAFMCILPLLNVAAISLSTMEAASTGKVTVYPIGFSLAAYKNILQKPLFLQTFRNSVLRVLAGVPLNMFLAILAAYPLSMTKDRLLFRQFYVWFFVIPMLVSGGLIPTYLTVKAVGLVDKFWALIIPGAVPIYNVILLVNYFKTIPAELEDAAKIDGAGYFKILWNVFVPCSLPAIATITLFCTVTHWNEWFDALIYMNGMEKFPLQSYLQVLLNQTKEASLQNLSLKEIEELSKINTRTYNAAQIVIATIPVIIIYPFLQKYFVTGLTLGSVKG